MLYRCLGDDLIFLDPHTVQPMVDTDTHDGLWDDSSYHCTAACRMNISNLDPSVALVRWLFNNKTYVPGIVGQQIYIQLYYLT